MMKIKQTVSRKTYRKSQTTTDKNGRRHCKTCGAYIGSRGKNVKTRVHK